MTSCGSRDPLMDWMTSCITRYSFGLSHTHNITLVEYEQNRINQALKSGILVQSSNPTLCRMYREAWEGALKGRHLVVEPTGSFYEMISLPLVAPRKPRRLKPSAKNTSPGADLHYVEELVDGKWVRTFYNGEAFASKMMDVMMSGNPFRAGTSAGGASQQCSEMDSKEDHDVHNVTNDDDVPAADDDDDVTAGATKPDIDMMVIDLDKKLYHIGQEGTDDMFAWMVPSEHPGFLHLIHPQTQESIPTDQLRSIDNVDDARAIAMLCFSKMNQAGMLPEIKSITNQGPAVTLEFDIAKLQVNFTDSMDVVRSLHCPTWPPQARKWDDKTYRWPDRKLADQIVADGCHIVAVPHPLCKESRLEYRFSFSHAEVLLTKSLVEGLGTKTEHTQPRLLAYMVVKFIVKFCIKKASQQIKSYYAKTTLYWYLESEERPDTAGFIWEHADKMLQQLQGFFRAGDLPNYCIPDNNMIRHVDESDCKLIVDAIQKVLDDPIGTILKIHREIVVLGCELNERSTGMIQVLQDLGFKPKESPHFSILNAAFHSLHHVISQTTEKTKSGVNHLCEFLQGSLGVALCLVQYEPKILSLLAMLNTITAFQQCSEICSKCQQEVSVVDMMFRLMISVLGSAPVLSARSYTTLTDLIHITCCYGFHESRYSLHPSVSRLQEYLTSSRHQAQLYRWCAVFSFIMAVQQVSPCDVVDSVDDCTEVASQKPSKGDDSSSDNGNKGTSQKRSKSDDGSPAASQKFAKCEIYSSSDNKASSQKLSKHSDSSSNKSNKAASQKLSTDDSSSRDDDNPLRLQKVTSDSTSVTVPYSSKKESTSSIASESSCGDTSTQDRENHQTRCTSVYFDKGTLQKSESLGEGAIMDQLHGDNADQSKDFHDVKAMYQKASSMGVPGAFSTVCSLEFALFLLHEGNGTAARALVTNVSLEALEEYSTMTKRHSDCGVCLEDVLKVSECRRIEDLKTLLQSIIQKIHNVHVQLKPLGMMVL